MRSRTVGGGVAVAAAGLAMAASLLIAVPGWAEPPKSLAEAQAELESLETKAETASEKFNEAEVALQEATRKVEKAQAKAKSAQASLDALSAATSHMAAHAYMGGSGVDPSLALLFADDAGDYLERASDAEQVARSQNATLRRVQARRLSLAQAQAALVQAQQAAKSQADRMAAHRREINDALEASKRVVAQLREEDRQRLAVIAADRRAKAAAAARKARQDAAQRPSGGGSDRRSSSGSAPVGSSRGAIAVRYALAQVGEPYSYNAQPPNSWDCSKLTTAAWAAAGVSLTPYSLAQAQQVRRVSVGELQPGDLLFYFNGARHVAMYIGGGKLVEAASPENGVQVQDAWNKWSRDHFSFAGRPAG